MGHIPTQAGDHVTLAEWTIEVTLTRTTPRRNAHTSADQGAASPSRPAVITPPR
jgi:hypothetical protein